MADINVLAELERIGWSYEFASESEVKVVCPFHDDTSPSNHINLVKRIFCCQTAGCKASGDFVGFLAGALRTPRRVVLEDLGTRYNIGDVKTIEASVVEQYHSALWKNEYFLNELHARGISDDLIRKYRLGENRDRITIPIKNGAGLYVNVRRYLPGAPGAEKMRNTKGRGKLRLYPIEQLEYESICICAGELKAVVAAHQLNRHGIGAISCTGGESNWEHVFTPHFKGKTVYVLYDIDDEGQAGAKIVLTQLSRVADSIHNVILPLDPDEFPHGDVNDYCGPALNKRLLPLIRKAEPWTPSRQDRIEYDEPVDVSLNAATHASGAGKRVRLSAVAAAAAEASYAIPKEVYCYCPKDQTECAICPVFPEVDDFKFNIPCESDAILEMVASPKGTQREALMRGVGIPMSCKVCNFKPTSFYNVEDVRVSPRLEILNREAERTMQPAMCIGDQIELNETYEFVGRMHPHPKTQQSTLLISQYKPTKDALSSYVVTDTEQLKLFQPDEWTTDGIDKKLSEIYDDFSANVTGIFERKDLHLAVDLAYHSPLHIDFEGKTIKGWTEVLIVGDSSQGKSDTAMGLMNHYGLGEKVECKNATVAGLLGGLQQISGRWFVSWGIIPTHDQRLVFLEELKGTSQEVISKLTDMRSSGIAEIPKIEKRRTQARTRLCALSNPRSNRPLVSYNFGVDAIVELIGALEDVRRFDFCLLVSERDIANDVLNRLREHRPVHPHRHTSELCRKVILWAWTRKREQVKFSDAAKRLIVKESMRLTEIFTEHVPIIDKGSTRYKLARLSAALAARTFSCGGDNCELLLVRECHVRYISDLLERVYSSDVFGYKDYSQAQAAKNTLKDKSVIERQIMQAPFVRDFVESLLYKKDIDLIDIQDWCGWDRSDAQSLLSVFVRKHALVREQRHYRKTPPFISMLKDLLARDLPERPDHIEEEF